MMTTPNKTALPGISLCEFLAELLGLSGCLLVENKCCQQNGVWVIAVTPRHVCLVCRLCASYEVNLHGTFKLDVDHAPFGIKRTLLRILVPRVFCHRCLTSTSVTPHQVVPHRRISFDHLRFLLDRY